MSSSTSNADRGRKTSTIAVVINAKDLYVSKLCVIYKPRLQLIHHRHNQLSTAHAIQSMLLMKNKTVGRSFLLLQTRAADIKYVLIFETVTSAYHNIRLQTKQKDVVH